MGETQKKWGAWSGIALGSLAFAAFVYFRVSYLHEHNQNVFWLAELFSPVAVFSVLIVTFVDQLVTPQAPQAKTRAAKKTRR